MQIGKLIHTIRYMTPRQWKYRIYYTIRNKVKKRKVKCSSSKIAIRLSLNYKNDIGINNVDIADRICQNEFITVSGIVKKFDNNIDWKIYDNTYRLVCFKLNSFKWLLELSDAYKATKNTKYISKGFELIEDWHRQCGLNISGDMWNPYVIAERLMNWIGFCSEYANFTAKDLSVYAGWIFEQAKELKNSIEYQLGANHLLSEGKALIATGVFLNEKCFLDYGKKVLLREVRRQFLSDGGHYERSIAYHVEALQQYFEAVVILQGIEDSQADKLISLLKEPYCFLNGMIGVNGEIPLFNDAAIDYPFYNAADFLATGGLIYCKIPPNARMGEYAKRWNIERFKKAQIEWNVRRLYKFTGYFHQRIKSKGNEYSLFFDAADNGPDSNLGHAHADALSIILFSNKKQILADSGVFTYKPGAERNYCRSTKAHNTIELDETNSAEIWSAFRVAKRGHTKILEYRNLADESFISASHDGYCHCLKIPAEHKRSIKVRQRNIQIEDQIISSKSYMAVSRFHIGPECNVKKITDNMCLIDECIKLICSLPIKITDCEVAEKFGIILETQCIEIPFYTGKNSILVTNIVLE